MTDTALSTNCIAEFEAHARDMYGALQPALDGLSEDCGMTINHSVWHKWRTGKRTPPPHVLRQINRAIVSRVVGLLDDDELDRIADALSPPDRG